MKTPFRAAAWTSSSPSPAVAVRPSSVNSIMAPILWPRSRAGPAALGNVCARRSPARSKSAANSPSVRSRPPGMTSMFRSENFPSAPSFGGARIRSITSSVASGDIAARQTQDLDRLLVLPVVDDRLQDVGVTAGGTASKKLPATMSQRSSRSATAIGPAPRRPPAPGRRDAAGVRVGAQERREKGAAVRRRRRRSCRSSRSRTPRESRRVRHRSVIDPIAPSKIALSSGCSARHSQTSVPWSTRNEFSPMRMLCSRLPQDCQRCGRPIGAHPAVERAGHVGPQGLAPAPSARSAGRPPRARTPIAARARRSR